MFWHIFKCKIKVLLRNKAMLFWTLIFPFVLGTFFHLAFSNINKAFEFEEIPLAIVDDEKFQNNETLKNIISSLSSDDEFRIFSAKYVTLEEANDLLDKETVSAYIVVNNDNPELIIKENGINQTIIKYILDQYYQMNSVANTIIIFNPEVIYNGSMDLLKENKAYVVDNSIEKTDFTLIYFLTLIAMACLYGSLIGLEIIKDCEANLSSKGARVCMAPVAKMKIIFAGLLSGYVVQVIALFFLFLYLINVLNVNLGNQIIPTVILSLVGCLAGTSLGTFVGVSNKKNEGFKIGLLIAVIMLFCFFSGMMGGPNLKGYYEETLPFLPFINPVHMITDGLYSLFAYDDLLVYYNCLIRISIFTIIMIILTFVFVRRKNYDSI